MLDGTTFPSLCFGASDGWNPIQVSSPVWVKAMRHTLRSKALVLLAFICSVGIRSRAQDPAQGVPSVRFEDVCGTPKQGVVCVFDSDLKSYQQTFQDRFGRAFEYKFERDEQPTFASGSTQLNPEHYLNQHTLTFKFSELFPTPSNLGSIVAASVEDKNPYSNKPKTEKIWVEGCPGDTIIDCLVKRRKTWQRALSGVRVSGSIFEWQGIEQGATANENVFPHYGKGGEIDFDPKNLFRAAT